MTEILVLLLILIVAHCNILHLCSHQIYTAYIANFDKSSETLSTWTKKSPKFASIIEDVQVRSWEVSSRDLFFSSLLSHLSLFHHSLITVDNYFSCHFLIYGIYFFIPLHYTIQQLCCNVMDLNKDIYSISIYLSFLCH